MENDLRRINEELAIERDRLAEVNDGLRDQVAVLKRSIAEREMEASYHDCSRALDEPQPVFADMSDDTVSAADTVVLYVAMYRERGDPSVGIGDSAYLVVCGPDHDLLELTWFETVTGGLDVSVTEAVRELAVRILARYEVQRARVTLADDTEPDLGGPLPELSSEEVMSAVAGVLYDADSHGTGIGYGEVADEVARLLGIPPGEVVK